MKVKTRAVLASLFLLAVGGSGVAYAQQSSEEARRERAEQQLDKARGQLEEALRLLREDDSREARREMERLVSGLRSAINELNRNRLFVSTGDAFRTLSFVGGNRIQMGVYLSTSSDDDNDSVGAGLESVVEGGPADEAGLEAGDVITKANGETLGRADRWSISPGNKLVRIKNELEEGDTLHVEYRRGAENHDADVILRKLESESYSFSFSGDPSLRLLEELAPRVRVGPQPYSVRGLPFGSVPLQWLDIELVSLDEELGDYFGTDEGLLIVRAPRESSLNLKTGDVILNIGDRKPTSAAHALRMIRSYDAGETIAFTIMRKKSRMTVTAELPESDSSFRRRNRSGGSFFRERRQ